jgi:hypothetical protein
VERGSESLIFVEVAHMHVYGVDLGAERREASSRMGKSC